MKIFSIFLILVSFITSCRQSDIRHSFSAADSLVVHFKDEKAGVITKTVQTTETKAISRMIDFMDAGKTQEFKCGYDGKMFFYAGEQRIQEVDFKMKDDSCRHFSFLLDGKLMSTKMSNEAVDFFDALEKGLPYYY